MLEFIKNIDLEFFLFLNGLHADWADTFFYIITNTFFWVPLYLLVTGLIIARWKKKSVIILLFMVLTVFFTDQSCNFLKKTIKRLRPSHDVELAEKVHLVTKPDGDFYRGGRFSFPSGHAANSVILVYFFGFFVRTRKKWPLILMMLWPLLFSYSRIYLGVHYPFDILAGFILGSCLSLLFIFITMKIIRPTPKEENYPYTIN